jgi:alpha-tubulin suppressor-like RCC1 family protein
LVFALGYLATPNFPGDPNFPADAKVQDVIWRWDGTHWAEELRGERSARHQATLYHEDRVAAMWGAAPDDGWAILQGAYHWDGDRWTESSPGGYAWDGTFWTPRGPSHTPCIWGRSTDDVWASFYYRGSPKQAWHWDGHRWKVVNTATYLECGVGEWAASYRTVWRRGTDADRYEISGTVSGAIRSGVTVLLGGDAIAATTTDTDGHYTFDGLENGTYTVSAQATGYFFRPALLRVRIGGDLAAQDFSATDNRNSGPAVKAFAGVFSSFVIERDGTLWGWGTNAGGLLFADATTENQLAPVRIGSGYSSFAAGRGQAVAIGADGTLWAWGNLAPWTPRATAPEPLGGGFVAVAAGYDFQLAVRTDGTLWAWGANYYGQLGDGTTTPSPAPKQVGSGFASVAAGSIGGSAGVKKDGTVWEWGKLALGVAEVLIPRQVGTDADWVAVWVGSNHRVALKTDGSLWTWGDDGTVPQQVGTDHDWATAAAGSGFTFAIKRDGTLWSWVMNEYIRLGEGPPTSRTTPEQIGTDFASVAAGSAHGIATKTDGSVWTWGSNQWGPLGDGTTFPRSVPTWISLAPTAP